MVKCTRLDHALLPKVAPSSRMLSILSGLEVTPGTLDTHGVPVTPSTSHSSPMDRHSFSSCHSPPPRQWREPYPSFSSYFLLSDSP